jgi:hypothetical protein
MCTVPKPVSLAIATILALFATEDGVLYGADEAVIRVEVSRTSTSRMCWTMRAG